MMSDFIFIVPFLFASLLLYATQKLRDYSNYTRTLS